MVYFLVVKGLMQYTGVTTDPLGSVYLLLLLLGIGALKIEQFIRTQNTYGKYGNLYKPQIRAFHGRKLKIICTKRKRGPSVQGCANGKDVISFKVNKNTNNTGY